MIDYLGKQPESLDVSHVVLVPDIYTLAYERMLYRGAGSFSIVVRSFAKLYHDRCEEKATLKKTQAILLVKKIAYDLKDELQCFSRSYQKTGFAKKVYETICRLREQGVKPEKLTLNSMRKAKIHDIRILYDEFVKRTQGKYVDNAGKIEKLTEYFNAAQPEPNVTYHVLNFDVLTDGARELLNAISCKSKVIEYPVAYIREPYAIKSRLRSVYRAVSDVDQLKMTARLIGNAAHDGVAFEDICVVTQRADYERISRIFKDFRIPFHLSKRIPLASHPLSAYLLLAAAAERRGRKREDVLAFANNPYLGRTKRETDAFGVYVKQFLVSYKGFSAPFDKESRYAEEAEAVRKAVESALKPFSKLPRSMTAEEWVDACQKVFKDRGDKTTLPVDAVSYERADEAIRSVLDGIASVYGGQRNSLDYFWDLTRDLLESTEFASVPQGKNALSIGPLNAFRGQTFKQVYLLSFEEGVLPKQQDDVALLTDLDLRELEQNPDFSFEPKIEILNIRYRDELWQLLQNEGDLVCAYVTGNGGKRSIELEKIEQSAWHEEIKAVTLRSLRERIIEKNRKANTPISEQEADEIALLQWQAKDKDARELYAKAKDKLETDASQYASALETVIDPQAYAELISTRENAAEQAFLVWNPLLNSSLYRASDKTLMQEERAYSLEEMQVCLQEISVSRVSSFYQCPFAYFCEHVLHLKPLADGSVTAVDVGTILHGALSEYLTAVYLEKDEEKRKKIVQTPLEEAVCAIVDELIDQNERAKLEENKGAIDLLRDEAVRLCSATVDQLKRGAYEVVACEAKIGGVTGKDKTKEERKDESSVFYEPIVFKGKGGSVLLKGAIDRVDEWGDYARIVDYKTGSAGKFSFADVYYGKKLQLPLYMEVVKRAGKKAGGYFYSQALAEWDFKEGDNKLQGVYDEADANVCAMDAAIEYGADSTVIDVTFNDKGEIKKKNALTSEQLDSMGAYATRMTQAAIEWIEKGTFLPMPRKIGKGSSCDYCEYAGVCGFDRIDGKVRSCSLADGATAKYIKTVSRIAEESIPQKGGDEEEGNLG